MNTYFTFFGHHKCATRYVVSIMTDVCVQLGLSKIEFSNSKKFGNNLLNYQEKHPHDFIFYTNSKYEYVNAIIDATVGFHLIRDPRDILISGYFSHLNSHPTDKWPELLDYRNKLKSKELNEGILLEMKTSKQRFLDLYNWNYDNSNILELKYEDLIINPYHHFIKILKHLDLLNDHYESISSIKYSAKILFNNLNRRFFYRKIFKSTKLEVIQLLQIVNNHDFIKKSRGRNPGSENIYSHYRKGIAGDWKNYFDESLKVSFKKEYGEILIKLGYEKDYNW